MAGTKASLGVDPLPPLIYHVYQFRSAAVLCSGPSIFSLCTLINVKEIRFNRHQIRVLGHGCASFMWSFCLQYLTGL